MYVFISFLYLQLSNFYVLVKNSHRMYISKVCMKNTGAELKSERSVLELIFKNLEHNYNS